MRVHDRPPSTFRAGVGEASAFIHLPRQVEHPGCCNDRLGIEDPACRTKGRGSDILGARTEDITGAKSYGALPKAVRDYVERIEALLGVKIAIVSVGPGREQTIWR